MKEHNTIGETAELLGVFTQTLRYYDKSPKYIDEKNRYRYYCSRSAPPYTTLLSLPSFTKKAEW
ncbi:hypothetical protein OBV_04810 [Oscillibacter valericigenes Sjm18-20]|nr:hypothetical protein OBV_04810 [Oscillibacter valericigenes Sjm18-20]